MSFAKDFLSKARNPEEEKTAKAAIRMISEMLMHDEDLPDELRVGLRLSDAAEKAHQKIAQMMELYVNPSAPGGMDHEARYPVRKELEDYLNLMIVGMDSFIQTHPVPEVKK